MKRHKTTITIELPAAITKADVPVCHALVDHANAKAVTIDGQEYEPKTLRYLGFWGRYDLTQKLFIGVHRFKVDNTPDLPLADFDFLPDEPLEPEALPVVAEAATDADHEDDA